MLMSYHNILLYLPPLLFQVCVRVPVRVRVKALSQSLLNALSISLPQNLSLSVYPFSLSRLLLCRAVIAFLSSQKHNTKILYFACCFSSAKQKVTQASDRSNF